jgi:hypothetical protein
MKQPRNKAKSVYLIWVLTHALLWAMATNNGNENRFFPLASDDCFEHFIDKYNRWNVNGTSSFQINDVYDTTEFLFYTIAPILIYYAILFWNKTTEINKQ